MPFVGISVAGCSPVEATGSGVVVDDGVILTSAHVLRGAETITLTWPDGSSGTADVLGFDAEMDLAYLGARTDGVTPVPLDSTDVVDGDAGTAWVVRDGLLVAIDVTVLRSVQIDTEDIYVEGETRRPGWELDAVIERGDSGGPVMVDGRVVGVLWARSSLASGRSYAIDPERAGDRIARQLADGDLGPDVDVARCP